MVKRKAIVIMGAIAMAGLLLIGCGKDIGTQKTDPGANAREVQNQVVSDSEQRAESETAEGAPIQEGSESRPASSGAMVGGWTPCESNNVKLTDEEQTIFDDALSKEGGLDYEGIAVIATQVVSGTNRAYLAYGGEKDGARDYAVIVVYSDLQGNHAVNSVAGIDPTDLHIKDAAGEHLLGGWEGATTGKAWMLPSEEAQSSFEELFCTESENMRNPIALLDTQVVAGVNYVAISMDREGNIYLSKWYQDLDGHAQIMEDGVIDMEYYTQSQDIS